MKKAIIYVPVSADDFFDARTKALSEQLDKMFANLKKMEKDIKKIKSARAREK